MSHPGPTGPDRLERLPVPSLERLHRLFRWPHEGPVRQADLTLGFVRLAELVGALVPAGEDRDLVLRTLVLARVRAGEVIDADPRG